MPLRPLCSSPSPLASPAPSLFPPFPPPWVPLHLSVWLLGNPASHTQQSGETGFKFGLGLNLSYLLAV